MMRIVVYIFLILAMAVSPTMAAASCASMSGGAGVMDMDDAGSQTAMDAMDVDNCGCAISDSPDDRDSNSAASCALACPGVYSGPDLSLGQAPAVRVVQYAIPPTDPGLPLLAHLDPPPPRI